VPEPGFEPGSKALRSPILGIVPFSKGLPQAFRISMLPHSGVEGDKKG